MFTKENVSSVLFITDYTSYQVHMPTMFPLFLEIRKSIPLFISGKKKKKKM